MVITWETLLLHWYAKWITRLWCVVFCGIIYKYEYKWDLTRICNRNLTNMDDSLTDCTQLFYVVIWCASWYHLRAYSALLWFALLCYRHPFLCAIPSPFSALTLLVWWREGLPVCKKKTGCWVVRGELCASYSSSCHHHLHHPQLQWNTEWKHSGAG